MLGKDIEITSADTSDADHADQNTSSAQSVLAKNPSVVVGPPSQLRGQEHLQAGHVRQSADDFFGRHVHGLLRP